MNVSESKFRQILREEARRVLREDAIAPTGPGTLKPGTPGVDPAGAVGNKEVANKLRRTIEQFDKGLNPMTKTQLINAINDLISKGRDSSVAAFVTAAGALSDPEPEGKGQLGALLAALMGKQSTGTVSGGQRTADDNAHIGFSGRADLAEILKNEIIARAAQNKMAGEVIHALVSLASLAPAPAPAPAAAPAAGAPTNISNDLVYTVKAGDSLSKILRTYYGIPATSASVPLYTAFANIANIKNMNAINIGQRITLPDPLIIGAQTFARKLNT
jgi:nucleoid-associated protein YgaU